MADPKKNPLQSARAEAVNVLIEENEDRFHELYAEKAKARGVTYTRPETPESRARKELERLRNEFPDEFNELANTNRPDAETPKPQTVTDEQGTPDARTSVDGSTVTG